MSDDPIDIPDPMTVDAVRAAWDAAADPYTEGQSIGRDHYRYAFFGPAQVAACGDVHGLQVLDVGCGNGYFAREMARGGANVTGVDISPRMIAHAEAIEARAPHGIAYAVLDAADVAQAFDAEVFDLATSCLALQDMSDPAAVFRAVHVVLRPAGRFVLTISHPCTDTPFREWRRAADGTKLSLSTDRYFERGPIVYRWTGWPADFSTAANHATLEDWLGWASGAGFTLRALREPRPTDAALLAHPDLDDAARVPYFLLLDLVRRSA